jgi:hypothetical protein
MFMSKHVALAAVASAILIQSSTGAQTGGNWQTFSSTAGRFSVMAPGAMATNVPTTDANGFVSHTFSVHAAGKAYVVAYADGNAGSDPQTEMNAARDALLKGIEASLVSEHRFKSVQPVGEVMATEISCRSESKGTECKARTFAHKSRIYMIGVLNRVGSGSSLDTDKFLDSFRITPELKPLL